MGTENTLEKEKVENYNESAENLINDDLFNPDSVSEIEQQHQEAKQSQAPLLAELKAVSGQLEKEKRKSTNLSRRLQESEAENHKLTEIINSTREILLVLGNKTKETAYFLSKLDPPIPKWKTPKERKATNSSNIPKDPFQFYEKHYASIDQYVSQAGLKVYNKALMDSIRNKVDRLRREGGDNIKPIEEIIPAKPAKSLTDKLVNKLCANLQLSSFELFKRARSIAASFSRT